MAKKDLIKFFGILLVLSQILFSCDNSSETTPTISSNLNVNNAYELINENQNNSDFIILDLRTSQEARQGIIKGAILLDYMKSNFKTKLGQLDRTKAYLIYCQSGFRSNKTQQLMEKMKFKKIYNMFSGFLSWRNNGHRFVYP